MWLKKEGYLVEIIIRTWSSDKITQTSKAEESGGNSDGDKVKGSKCTGRHETARHAMSPALTQEESFFSAARKDLVLTWLLLGSKRVLIKGSQFGTCSVSKTIYLGSELHKIMRFQDLMAYLLKSFNKEKSLLLRCPLTPDDNIYNNYIYWVLKMN